MKTYLRILRYSPRLKWRLVQFFVFSVLESAFNSAFLLLIFPVLNVLFPKENYTSPPPIPAYEFSFEYFKGLLDHHLVATVLAEGPSRVLFFICVAVVSLMFLYNLFRYIARMAASRIKVDVVRNLRKDLFSHVSRLHIGYFNDQRKGDLISRFTNDVSEVEGSVMNSLKFVWKEPIKIVFLFGLLFSMSVKMTLFTLVFLPLTGGMLAGIVKRLKRQARQSQEALGRVVNMLDETFGGMRVVKAFNARGFLLRKMDDETTHHRDVNLSMARKNELASPVSEVLGSLIMAGLLYVGGTLVFGGQAGMEADDFVAFIVIFSQIIQPAKDFSNGLTSLQKGTVAAQRIFSTMEIEPAIVNKPNAKSVGSFNDSIEFSHVSFAYDREEVLSDINFVIRKGTTVALVGPSGGGKSTLADLVPRFYDPTRGEVRMDGVPLTQYDLESLRGLIGVVTQESILFNDTMFNNIAFGKENVLAEDVIAAAKVANAHDFIMETEHGYDTVIGERGSKLSGGQRQRLSIARAVLKNPPILILDEATSALDSESERLVQEALTNLMKNRTSLVIAHRLSTIQHADEILVIQEGRIVQRGTHHELINQGGLYRKLREIQKA